MMRVKISGEAWAVYTVLFLMLYGVFSLAIDIGGMFQ